MRKVTKVERRQLMVQRHHLAGDAQSPESVVHALVALHATDPASVYLSVLARSATAALRDVAEAMYERRSLVRWMAMRRTLFVFGRDEIPTVQAAVSTPLAEALRRQLLNQLRRDGSGWAAYDDRTLGRRLAELEDRVVLVLERHGTATGAQLRTDEPELATRVPARSRSESPQSITSSLLVVMSADGQIVRSTPTGPWTSRHHRWAPVSDWWPDGLPAVDPTQARQDLARRWLSRFGPATVEDLRWWTGWTKATTRQVLGGLPVEEVDLHGESGIELAEPEGGRTRETAPQTNADPTVTLLPALDPTPMGWKRRDWFLAIDPARLFDRAGNIGPTLWWEGEIIGSWAVAGNGDIRTVVLADRGADAAAAVDREAARLHDRLDGAAVTPAARTPLEKSLTTRTQAS